MSQELSRYEITWNDQRPVEEPSNGDLEVLERGWFEVGAGEYWMNQWQMGLPLNRSQPQNFSAVYACRKVLAEEVSRLTAYHYRLAPDGGKEKLNSTLTRILRYPNSWQSSVDFWLNMVDCLLISGNAYAIASRDDRGAITTLTQVRDATPHVDPDTGLIFYGVGVDSTIPKPPGEEPDPKYLVPQSEVLHLRLFTPVHPLIGEPPLVAAMVAAHTGQAISNSAFSVFNAMSRPSGYLKHPKRLNEAARVRLKEAWQKNYSGKGIGGVAVLEDGMEWAPMSMTAVDAEIVDQYKLQVEDVSRVYRVPMFMLGDMSKSTFANVEQMTRSFYAGGLAFYLELIEAELARFFALPMTEYVEFDIESGLTRAEMGERISALTKGVQGGVFSPNEARRREGLPAVSDGDAPLVQQQMVPLSYAAHQSVAEAAPVAPSPEDDLSSESMKEAVRRKLGLAA